MAAACRCVRPLQSAARAWRSLPPPPQAVKRSPQAGSDSRAVSTACTSSSRAATATASPLLLRRSPPLAIGGGKTLLPQLPAPAALLLAPPCPATVPAGCALRSGRRTNAQQAAAASSHAGGEAAPSTLYLFDGTLLAYRGFYGLRNTPLSTRSGKDTRAVYGFTSFLLPFMQRFLFGTARDSAAACVFDSPRSNCFREQQIQRARAESFSKLTNFAGLSPVPDPNVVVWASTNPQESPHEEASSASQTNAETGAASPPCSVPSAAPSPTPGPSQGLESSPPPSPPPPPPPSQASDLRSPTQPTPPPSPTLQPSIKTPSEDQPPSPTVPKAAAPPRLPREEHPIASEPPATAPAPAPTPPPPPPPPPPAASPPPTPPPSPPSIPTANPAPDQIKRTPLTSEEHEAILGRLQDAAVRMQSVSAYKETRSAMPDELRDGFDDIRDIVSGLGISIIDAPADYEADDVIGTLAMRAWEQGMRVVIVSSDKDYNQLLRDNISIMRPPAKGNDIVEVTEADFVEEYGLPPACFVDLLALCGDASDSVPGVKGIGWKTAPKLLQKFGDLENLLAHLDEVEPVRIRKLLEEDGDIARLSKALVTLHCDMAGPGGKPWDLAQFTYHGIRLNKLLEIFDALEFERFRHLLPHVLTLEPEPPGDTPRQQQ